MLEMLMDGTTNVIPVEDDLLEDYDVGWDADLLDDDEMYTFDKSVWDEANDFGLSRQPISE